MARGDSRPYRGRGGGWGGGGSSYDDEGRGTSKSVWERFQRQYTESGFSFDWAMHIDNRFCYDLIRDTTSRFNLYDGPTYWNRRDSRGSEWVLARMKENDSRVSRIVIKHNGLEKWLKVYDHILEGYELWEAEQEERRRVSRLKYEKERAEEAIIATRIAKQIREEEHDQISQAVELTAGALQTDMYQIMLHRDAYGLRDGDWIDDVAGAYMGVGGFAEEQHHYQSGNIKVQITLSLDKSSSMRNNGLDESARQVFVEAGLALRQLREQYPNDVYTAYFTFADGENGDRVEQLGTKWDWESGSLIPVDYSNEDEYSIYEFNKFRRIPSKYDTNGYYYENVFTGYDTYFHPLFKAIKKWEDKDSVPGAVRLDLIITDAVIEHASDIRESNQIQANRNGNLQTVLLNLLPEREWVNSSLPYKCTQYGVNKDNLAGVLRTLLSEFLSLYI